MLTNYFKIAFRNLMKHSAYSFINISGLSVGIASAILILLWVADEIGYNRFHKNYETLYQVHMNREVSDGIATQNSLPYPLKEVIRSKSSRIKHIAMTNWGEGNLLAVDDKRLNKVGMCVSEDFLKMFTFPLLKGDPNTALNDPTSIVLTEATAKALFGESDPIGQLVKIDNNRSQAVTGIVADPEQSTFDFDYLMPFAFYEATQEWVRRSHDSWDNNSFQMFVQLETDVDAEEVRNNIKDLIRENVKTEPKAELIFQPMKNWRLYSSFKNGKVDGGMIEYVRLFSAIAIFVLVIACINFMNLATARSESRAREVGIRKSVGSSRKHLIIQFLGESILITLLGFLVALFIVELVLPFYNTLVNKKLFIDFMNPVLWMTAFSIILLTGFVAGSYPAFYLSAFQPAKVLKGKVQTGKGASLPRKVLVTIQFSFSILLIVGTVVIYQQIQHVKDREIGYDRENLLLIWTNTEIETNFETIKDELKRTGVVKGVCKSNSPITRIFSSNTAEWPGMPPGARVDFTTIATEYDYTETMGIRILEGRDFSRDFKSDSNAVLVNKSAVDMMGLQNPIGEKIKMWGAEKPIVGVMENVVMGAPDQPVHPLIMVFDPEWSSTISVKLEKTANLAGAVSKVENVFKKLNPSYPLWYRFADTEFDTKFNSINLTSKLAGIFASLAIFITCMGLFGLASFTAEQRTKEIGIRKVMGATVSSLVALIARDFSRLVLIAFIFAGPLSWFALNSFLERYPYRIPIYWWVLPAVGMFALIIAVIIVSTQAFKAAISNPSTSLRSE